MTAGTAVQPSFDLAAPSLGRRLASFVYEGVLLFGVLMIAGYLFSSLTQQRHALTNRHALQAFLFVVLGIYFAWFWSHGGQTVAMKAWRIRVVDRHGRPLTQRRALLRYLLSWLWFMPALLATSVWTPAGAGGIFGALLAGVVVWALLSRLHPTRQFLHDILSGTRLIATDAKP
jgi:uncharacterized RDD family membrane protein YckC